MLSTTVAQRTNVWADMKFLEVAEYFLGTFDRIGQQRPMPQNKGLVAKFRRWEKLSLQGGLSSFVMQEGVTPPGQDMSATDYPVSLTQYGNHVRHTDVMQFTYEDPIFSETVRLLGIQGAELSDLVTFGGIVGGTNVFFESTSLAGTSIATTAGSIKPSTLDRITTQLMSSRAKFIVNMSKATTQVSTQGLLPGYIAGVHTDLLSDLNHMSGFIQIHQYPASAQLWPGELGSYGRIRFVDASLGLPPALNLGPTVGADSTAPAGGNTNLIGSTNADIYPILIVGEDSFGIVPLSGKGSVSVKTVPVGRPSDSDPHGQRGSVAFDFWKASAILNDDWIVRYHVGRNRY